MVFMIRSGVNLERIYRWGTCSLETVGTELPCKDKKAHPSFSFS